MPQMLLSALFCLPMPVMADEPGKVEQSPIPAARAAMANARKTFAKARFYKPGNLDPSQTAHEFAPLIVEEVQQSQVKSTRKMGFTDTESKRSIFEPDTVYFHTGKIQANGQAFEQIIFLWAYKESAPNPNDDKPAILVRGVRVILGADGMPALWEALVGPAHPRIFFVSQAVEKAARAQFGEPLSPRTFAVEQKSDALRDVVVAGTLDDGPVPMGPYVYVDDNHDRLITAIHCRCSPSQFDEAVETNEYKLLPAENLDVAWLRDQAGIVMERWLECEPLDTLFRWPKAQP